MLYETVVKLDIWSMKTYNTFTYIMTLRHIYLNLFMTFL